MLATKRRGGKPGPKRNARQNGTAAVEFALVAVVFFSIVFGIIELARAMYMYNTMAEVTRSAAHAAASVSFNDGDALNLVRKRAVLDEANGHLPFGHPVTFNNVRIEYLYLPPQTSALQLIPQGSMPSSPARNRINCMTNPNGIGCIRAVQARICQEGAAGGACTPVIYQSLVSIINFPLRLPMALTIVSAESFGYKAGDSL
jgi:hypothetical protein